MLRQQNESWLNIFLMILVAIVCIGALMYIRSVEDTPLSSDNIVSERDSMDKNDDINDSVVSGDVVEELLFVTGDYPPFVSEGQEGYGVHYQLVTAVLEEMGVPYRIEFYPWKRGLKMIDDGEALGTFPYAMTQQRLEKYMFTDNLMSRDSVQFEMFYYKPFHDFSYLEGSEISDLVDFRIGGLSGYFYLEYFDEAGINLDYSVNEVEVFQKLLKDRVDFLPIDLMVADYIIEEYYSEMKDDFLSFSVQDFQPDSNYCMMFGLDFEGVEEYRDAFNEALQIIIENGTYETIMIENGYADYVK